MSYEAAVLWSIIRSLLAGGLCTGLARVLIKWRRGRSPSPENISPITHRLPTSREDEAGQTAGGTPLSRVALFNTLLTVPFFMPGLVVGYAYRNASLSLLQTPTLNELLYLAIIVSQLLPVAVLALEWLPPAPLGTSAKYCLGLANQRGRRPIVIRRWTIRRIMAGELPRITTAAAVVALLCFQEVEVATLMQARGWAEWIFTKQAGGVELVEVWRSLLIPMAYGLILVVPVLIFWGRRAFEPQSGNLPPPAPPHTSRLRGPAQWTAITIIIASWSLTIIWPVISLAIGAIRGAGVLQLRSAIWREIGDALILAFTVTGVLGLMLWSGTKSLGQRPIPFRSSQLLKTVVAVGCGLSLLPGLLGSLALGLAIFEICQQIGVRPSYSPVPLVMGMVLFLVPRALGLFAIWRTTAYDTATFQAEQLSEWPGNRGSWGKSIVWKMRDAGRFWMLAILFWWSYLELTLPSLLRPAGMAPAPMRLYNFLHYGHIPGLAAMLVLVLAIPATLAGLGYLSQAWRFRPSK